MIRCASVSSYMGPYISNYVLSEIAIEKKFKEKGDYLIHVFPKEVEDKGWGNLFREIGAKVYYIDYKPGTWASIRDLRSIFKEENINIIHCHFGGWDIDSKLASPFIPIVWHQRMYVNLISPKRRIKYWLKYNVLGALRTYNIAISEAVYDAIKSITNKPTYYIPDCIDFSRIQIDLDRRMMPYEPNKILLFGYSPIVKGLDIAFKACEILNREGISVELDVVSQAESDDYIKKNYDPKPKWFKVLGPTDNVSEYYNNAAIFLSASRSEGFSNSLLEAIYCGCPSIFSDIPGTKWAADFEHTFEYEVESEMSLVEAIKKCLNQSITKEEIDRNRAKALSNYSIDQWINKVYSVLDNNHL